MHIWLINSCDDLPWEGKPPRYATLARCLVERGHTVVHWSSDFSHRLKAKRVFPEEAARAEIPYAIELVPCPPYRKNVSLARIWNHRCFGKRLLKRARESVRRGDHAQPDIVFASMPPMEGPEVALGLKKDFGCRVILDVMDAWPATLLQAFPRRVRALGKALLIPYALQLSKACRNADAISAQSRTFADFAHRNGAEGKPTFVCLLGADLPTFPPSHLSTTSPISPLRLLYLGAMGRSYDLATLLDAVERINRDAVRVELVLVGDGEKRAPLEARKVPHVEFTGFLSGEALAARLRDADLGMVPFFPDSGVAVPYKAGEYLAYGLPLISSIDGELGELIRNFSCGSVYAAEHIDGLVRVIQSYLDNPQKLADEKAAARDCFHELFDSSVIYPRFAEWICENAEILKR